MHLSRNTTLAMALAAALFAAGWWAVYGRHVYLTPTLPEPTRATGARPSCDALEPDDRFFPRGRMDPVMPVNDQAFRRDYASLFAAMDMTSLSCGDVDGEVYRVIRLEPVGPPTVVQIERSRRGSIHWSAVQLEAPLWRRSGRVVVRAAGVGTEDDWRRVETAIAHVRFWALDTAAYPLVTKDQYSPDGHGSPWILEGRRGNSYHVVHRRSFPQGPFHEAANTILGLAGLAVHREER